MICFYITRSTLILTLEIFTCNSEDHRCSRLKPRVMNRGRGACWLHFFFFWSNRGAAVRVLAIGAKNLRVRIQLCRRFFHRLISEVGLFKPRGRCVHFTRGFDGSTEYNSDSANGGIRLLRRWKLLVQEIQVIQSWCYAADTFKLAGELWE